MLNSELSRFRGLSLLSKQRAGGGILLGYGLYGYGQTLYGSVDYISRYGLFGYGLGGYGR